MSDTLAPLILDFLEWLAESPRPYSEVMDVWRTSCPRLTVWEDALDRGFLLRHTLGQELVVDLTSLGRSFLQDSGRVAHAADRSHRQLFGSTPHFFLFSATCSGVG